MNLFFLILLSSAMFFVQSFPFIDQQICDMRHFIFIYLLFLLMLSLGVKKRPLYIYVYC